MAIFDAVIGGWLSDTWQKKNRRARMLLPAIAGFVATAIFLIGARSYEADMDKVKGDSLEAEA